MSNSWRTNSNSEDEKSPLLMSDSSYRHYTEGKVLNYEKSRKLESEVRRQFLAKYSATKRNVYFRQEKLTAIKLLT